MSSDKRMTRVVPELDGETRYTLRVRAISRFNVPSEWSEAIDFVTPHNPFAPDSGGIPRPVLLAGEFSSTISEETTITLSLKDSYWPHENAEVGDSFVVPFYATGVMKVAWKWSDPPS